MHAPDGGGAPEALQEAVVNEQPPAKAAQPQRKPTTNTSKPSADGVSAAAPGLGAAKRVSSGPAVAPGRRPVDVANGIEQQQRQQQAPAHEVTELKLSVDNLERERDFYYMKLREVEILCQQHEGESIPFLQEVLEILYKTDEADEFVNPEEQEPVLA